MGVRLRWSNHLAGMTAYLVLLAQTRVRFLSGGRGKSFHQLPPQEQAFQKEEAL